MLPKQQQQQQRFFVHFLAVTVRVLRENAKFQVLLMA